MTQHWQNTCEQGRVDEPVVGQLEQNFTLRFNYIFDNWIIKVKPYAMDYLTIWPPIKHNSLFCKPTANFYLFFKLKMYHFACSRTLFSSGRPGTCQ